jgi:hypothetical protein
VGGCATIGDEQCQLHINYDNTGSLTITPRPIVKAGGHRVYGDSTPAFFSHDLGYFCE